MAPENETPNAFELEDETIKPASCAAPPDAETIEVPETLN